MLPASCCPQRVVGATTRVPSPTGRSVREERDCRPLTQKWSPTFFPKATVACVLVRAGLAPCWGGASGLARNKPTGQLQCGMRRRRCRLSANLSVKLQLCLPPMIRVLAMYPVCYAVEHTQRRQAESSGLQLAGRSDMPKAAAPRQKPPMPLPLPAAERWSPQHCPPGGSTKHAVALFLPGC